MSSLAYSDIFSRTFSYLRHEDFQLNRESALATLKLIEELLVAEAPDVLDRVLVELPKRFALADINVPVACPPIQRSSIGYPRG